MKRNFSMILVLIAIIHLGCTASVSGPGAPDLGLKNEHAKPQPSQPVVTSLATGDSQACAVVRGKISCWGPDAKKTMGNLGDLSDIKQVTIDRLQVCVLLEGAVKCSTGFGIIQPDLKNPKHLSGGIGSHTCAIDDTGVKCWGEPGPHAAYYSVLVPPPLKNPTHISAGHLHTCAITEDGVKCWGNPKETDPDISVPRARQLAMSQYISCALGGNGVQCWNGSVGPEVINKLNAVNPKQLSITDSYFCVIGDKGVTCAGRYDYRIMVDPPVFREPNLVSVASSYACAADADGIKCWGEKSDMGKLVPDFGLTQKTPAPPAPLIKTPVAFTSIANGKCLKSWNWESASGLVCLNQGYFSFFNILEKDPYKFALELVSKDGSTAPFKATKTNLISGTKYFIGMNSSSGNIISFDGIDFGHESYEPAAGYVIYSGNSGSCGPVVAGSFHECLKEIRGKTSYGDSVNLDHFTYPAGTETSVENCNISAEETFQGFVKFKITSEKCAIGLKTLKNGDSIRFNLRDPKNYPVLTTLD
jgi:hypothetical protein